MEFLLELWMPILVGGLAVFVVSSIAWTVLPHHKREWGRLPDEEAVAEALRANGGVSPGLYTIPYCPDHRAMRTPEFVERMNRGPVAFLTVTRPGVPAMGPMMAKSLVMNLVVAVFVAYVAWHAVPAGAEYLHVFRIVGTVTFMACALGSMADSIWFGRPWASWARQALDALLYAGAMGGVFGWLWA